MSTLLRQEMFKLKHQVIAWLTPILSLVIMTIFAGISKIKPDWIHPSGTFSGAFSGDLLLPFFLIVIAATIITSEFQFGTIKALLYRKFYRGEVFASKVIVLAIYSIMNYVLIALYSLILKLILFGNTFKFGDKINGKTLIAQMGISLLSSFLGIWLIIALVLLVANLFKTSSAAITVGIIVFFAASVLQIMQSLLIAKWDWVKWNPLNMLNAGPQIADSTLKSMTSLTTPVIISGSIIYTIVFVLISYTLFKKRNV